MARQFAPEPGDDEAKARTARCSTKELIRDLRRVKVKLGRLGRRTAEYRAVSKTRRWITAELLGRYPAALRAVRAARVAAITKIEKRGLDYDHVMIDAIPAAERGSDYTGGARGLSAAQKEVLITILGWARQSRMRGFLWLAPEYPLEGHQTNTARSLVKSGYLRTDSEGIRFLHFQFTEQGLRAAEELYTDMGLDVNVLYQSETKGPENVIRPDVRPAGRMTANAVAFTADGGHVFQACAPTWDGRYTWRCLLCDDDKQYTDRFVHWQWHMRLAATVDVIDWANPVVTKGNRE